MHHRYFLLLFCLKCVKIAIINKVKEIFNMGNLIDLTGKRFGKWTVIERDEDVNKKNIYWKCQCDCGTIRSVAGTSLRSGISVSCGCERDRTTSLRTKNNVDDITGKRYGMWTVLRRDLSGDNKSKRGARWICRCDCGNEKSVLGYALKSGKSTSCGCIGKKKQIIDLTGQRFGKLVVLKQDLMPPEKGRGAWWICKCDCGNTITVPSGRLRSGDKTSCGCERNKRKKNNEDIIGERFGFWTVLSEDQSNKKKEKCYLCRCDCGTIKSVSKYSLVNGRSLSCGCKTSTPELDLTGCRFGMLTVIGLNPDYKGKGIYWKCKCECGKIKSFRTNALKNGKVKSCGCQNHNQASERLFKDISNQRFGRLVAKEIDHKLADKNGNTKYYWKCQCDCGNEIVVVTSSLINGDTKSCGCLQAEESSKRAKERIIDLTGKRFGLLTVVERVELEETGFGMGLWKCLCDCGNTKMAEGYYLRKGMISSCGCLKQSKLELYVLQYFDERGYISSVDYEYQKRFDGLRGYGEGMLSFDFAFYENKELRFLIECQGQQHYMPVGIFGGEEQFAKQQLHDELKKDFAKKMNVQLIEIPYSAETFENVKRILSDVGL